MITFSRLGFQGQLGNQMFQYALLLGVADRTGYEIRIPKTFKGRKKYGFVELKPFNITSKTLNVDHYMRTCYNIFNKFVEQSHTFDPRVFEQPDNTDYSGYFQTEKYFSHVRDKIREEFRFDPGIENPTLEYIKSIRQGSIISVHVRRGDYLQTPQTFHVLSKDYFERVMDHPELPQNKQFLVFSDDIPWCKENLKSKHRIDFSPFSTHWQDMCAMTFCDAHIISGSSFSWWGAWLSHSRPNVVIAPYPWFPAGSQWKSMDIYLDGWIRERVISAN